MAFHRNLSRNPARGSAFWLGGGAAAAAPACALELYPIRRGDGGIFPFAFCQSGKCLDRPRILYLAFSVQSLCHIARLEPHGGYIRSGAKPAFVRPHRRRSEPGRAGRADIERRSRGAAWRSRPVADI